MPTLGSRSIRLLFAAFALLVLGPGVARAGLVSGRWDPQFGAFLPGLNWQVRAQMLVPNACSALADGVYTTAFGACAGSRLDSVYLRMFDTGQDPNDFFTITGTVTATTSTYWGWCYTGSTEPHCYNFNVNFFTLSAVRVQAGQVVAHMDTDVLSAQRAEAEALQSLLSSLAPELIEIIVAGLILGVIFAYLIGIPLKSDGFALSYPVGQLFVILVLTALAGVLAAIYPARKASKLDVLEAVSYE